MPSVNDAMTRHGMALDDIDKIAEQIKEASIDLANMELEYDLAFAAAIVDERQAGTPATLVKDICRGKDDIAELAQKIKVQKAIVAKFRDDQNTLRERSQATYNMWKQAQDYEKRDWLQSGMGAYGA